MPAAFDVGRVSSPHTVGLKYIPILCSTGLFYSKHTSTSTSYRPARQGLPLDKIPVRSIKLSVLFCFTSCSQHQQWLQLPGNSLGLLPASNIQTLPSPIPPSFCFLTQQHGRHLTCRIETTTALCRQGRFLHQPLLLGGHEAATSRSPVVPSRRGHPRAVSPSGQGLGAPEPPTGEPHFPRRA